MRNQMCQTKPQLQKFYEWVALDQYHNKLSLCFLTALTLDCYLHSVGLLGALLVYCQFGYICLTNE